MTKFFDRYLSFDGRLARLPFFARSLSLGVTAGVIFFISIPFFSNGGRFWWWIGLLVVIAALVFLVAGLACLIVCRYHAIFGGASVLSYAPPKVILFALPVFLINFWLMFWRGDKKTNRFGEVPE